jgi:hypothetical protein
LGRALTNDAGFLTTTIDGDPINVGGRVVGRRVAGGTDEALSPAEFDAITTAATGEPATMVAQHAIGRDLGRTRVNRATKRPLGVALSRGLDGDHLEKVYAHEIGHVVDQLAGEIKASGISDAQKRRWAASERAPAL